MDVVKTPARLTPATSALAPPKVARESGSPDVPPLFIVSRLPVRGAVGVEDGEGRRDLQLRLLPALRPETAALPRSPRRGRGGGARPRPRRVPGRRGCCASTAGRRRAARSSAGGSRRSRTSSTSTSSGCCRGSRANAKPVLIQKSARPRRPDFLEMDVDTAAGRSSQAGPSRPSHLQGHPRRDRLRHRGPRRRRERRRRALARARVSLSRARRARASLRRRAPSLLRPTPIQAMLGCNLFNIDPTTVRPIGAVGPDDMSGKAEC